MEGLIGLILLGGAVISAFVIFFALLLLALINSKAARTNDLLEYLIQIQPRLPSPPVPPPSATPAPPCDEPVEAPSFRLLG